MVNRLKMSERQTLQDPSNESKTIFEKRDAIITVVSNNKNDAINSSGSSIKPDLPLTR